MYIQKVKHLEYEHENKITKVKSEAEASLQGARVCEIKKKK